ncbi:splicing factor YJU2-like isoform X2 [Tubulanus polymorphus]
MAPFNMRCNTCREYIYKGKKFNSRKETVEDENYLGLHIFRFYIKCPKCVAEIAFKTDPQSTDYTLEAGATRNFEPIRTAEKLAKEELAAAELEEINNPMKVLENRTKASRNEMEMIETLEELRDLNARHAKVDHEYMIKLSSAYEEQLRQLQDEEDEQLVQSVFGDGTRVKRLADSDSDNDAETDNKITQKKVAPEKASDILLSTETKLKLKSNEPKSFSTFSSKSSLKGLVKRKQPQKAAITCSKAADTKSNIAEARPESQDSGQTVKAESNSQESKIVTTAAAVESEGSSAPTKTVSKELLSSGLHSVPNPFLISKNGRCYNTAQQQKTFRMPESSILNRIRNFFPVIEKANERLKDSKAVNDVNIENVNDDEPYIEMDVTMFEQNGDDVSGSSDYDSCDDLNIENIGEVTEDNIRLSKKPSKPVVIEEIQNDDFSSG